MDGKTAIMCNICGKTLKSTLLFEKHHLNIHQKNVITNVTVEHKCHICLKILPTSGQLKTHINTFHLKLINHKCKICGLGRFFFIFLFHNFWWTLKNHQKWPPKNWRRAENEEKPCSITYQNFQMMLVWGGMSKAFMKK